MADCDPRPPPLAKLPLGSIAELGTGLTLWCASACPHLREHGYRHQIIYSTEDIAAFGETYGPGVIFLDSKERLRCAVCGSAKVQFILSCPKTSGEHWWD